MCGICAFIGHTNGYNNLMFGLKMLQNRGYDSAGICMIKDGKLVIRKYASIKDKNAVEKLQEFGDLFSGSSVGCVHSRWATTGAKNDTNSHPHIDYKGNFALVHNGIIENYASLKKELIETHKVVFQSQTDTEVIVNLISVYYDESKNVEKAINMALNRLEGTWGLVIMCTHEPNNLYCARHGSPLLIGFSDTYMMIASEQSGFCKYVDNYICLENNDIVVLKKENGKVKFEELSKYPIRNITINDTNTTPFPFSYWTIKEIHEQYDSSKRAMGMGGRILNDKEVKLGGLNSHINDLKGIEHLIILGCGTSYFAGLYCVSTFKQLSGFISVQIFDGAEFTKYDIPSKGKTGAIFLSQSGETKDLHRAMELAKDNNVFTIGVVNVVDSLIPRDSDCGVYLNAGREVAVASTKAFTSQVIVLNMIAIWFAQIKNINETKRMRIIKSLRRLPIDIKNTIESTHKKCIDVAKYLINKESMFVLGKGSCEAVAKEGSLKIKEIGYIHAEGYSTSSLKHGPYSLIVKGTPVIVVSPDDEHFKKNNSVIEEILSREGYVIGISNKKLNKDCKVKIKIPKNESFSSLLSVIPMQLIAFELALLKGHSPDLPRGLCKAVTVD